MFGRLASLRTRGAGNGGRNALVGPGRVAAYAFGAIIVSNTGNGSNGGGHARSQSASFSSGAKNEDESSPDIVSARSRAAALSKAGGGNQESSSDSTEKPQEGQSSSSSSSTSSKSPDEDSSNGNSSNPAITSDKDNGNYNSSTAPLCKSISVYASRGPRAAMEDEYFISEDNSFFGVYDGHGGARVSKFARDNLYKEIKKNLDQGANPGTACMSAFRKVSESILGTKKYDMEGSTAVTVLLEKDRLWTANLGDSRAVLCRDGEAVAISEDHKPNSASEKARVEALGGNVRWYGYLGPDRQPVPGMGAYRINGNLAVSRAFGDRLETPFVSDEPDICCFERNHETDRFIILASDGLWDVMSSQEAVRFVQQILAGSVGALGQGDPSRGMKTRSPSRSLTKWMRSYSGDASMVRAVLDTRKAKIAKYLVEESLRRGTADNVTVVVLWLR